VVVRVVEVPAEATHDLRARVLRDGTHDDVVFPDDDDPGTVHLAAVDDRGRILAVGSFYRIDGEVKLRGMAVEPARQGSGAGRAILEEAHRRFRGQRLWASVRDGAIGFYERLGWRIVGEGFDTPHGPHHHGEIDL
jgi:GNAT superfamily N-acetyltransferase